MSQLDASCLATAEAQEFTDIPPLSLPPHAVDVLLLLAKNELLRTRTAQLQLSLVSVRGNFADAMAENAELTRNADQQFFLFSDKLERLKA